MKDSVLWERKNKQWALWLPQMTAKRKFSGHGRGREDPGLAWWTLWFEDANWELGVIWMTRVFRTEYWRRDRVSIMEQSRDLQRVSFRYAESYWRLHVHEETTWDLKESPKKMTLGVHMGLWKVPVHCPFLFPTPPAKLEILIIHRTWLTSEESLALEQILNWAHLTILRVPWWLRQ